jgi:hypothetical protein
MAIASAIALPGTGCHPHVRHRSKTGAKPDQITIQGFVSFSTFLEEKRVAWPHDERTCSAG